jgi:hypothetical protein
MISTQQLLRPAYEPGDGQADGSQLVNGEWYMPVYGCDSLSMFIEQLPYKLIPELVQSALGDCVDADGHLTEDYERFARALLKHLLHPLNKSAVVDL